MRPRVRNAHRSEAMFVVMPQAQVRVRAARAPSGEHARCAGASMRERANRDGESRLNAAAARIRKIPTSDRSEDARGASHD